MLLCQCLAISILGLSTQATILRTKGFRLLAGGKGVAAWKGGWQEEPRGAGLELQAAAVVFSHSFGQSRSPKGAVHSCVGTEGLEVVVEPEGHKHTSAQIWVLEDVLT